MMVYGRILSLLTLLVTGTSFSNADCTSETAALLNSPNVTVAYAQMNADILTQVSTCVMDGNDNCAVSVDTSGVEEACTGEDGKITTPQLDITCDNSNTGLASTIQYNYVLCIGANCTGTEAESTVNNVLANITDAINEVVSPDGVECSATLTSGSNQIMSVGAVISLVTLLSYKLI
jgi:hypothetical protein